MAETQEERTPLDSETSNGKFEHPRLQDIEIEAEKPVRLYYRISDNPSFHLCILFAVQQALLSISGALSVSQLVSEVVCARDDREIQAQLLGTTIMMSGIATLLMCLVGVRLPIFQGPTSSYVTPLIALTVLDDWKCPTQEELASYYSNSTMTYMNNTDVKFPVPREIIYGQLSKLQGSLMVAGTLHWLIGFTGLVGVVARYVGPITIVATLVAAIQYFLVISTKFCETHWGVAIGTSSCGIILSLYLRRHKTPIPLWSRKKGFYIFWYPLHLVYSILISILFGWCLSAIFTYTGVFNSDVNSKQFYARTDSRNDIIYNNPWFFFPYPSQFGSPSFNTSAFITMFIATLMSIVDSICDYNVCAQTCYVPYPPTSAVNRGIFFEGLMSFFAGWCGDGHATSSYGGNIGVIGITKVASRRVFIFLAFFYMLFAILGKFNAVFITMPYCVLGGVMLLYFGILIGVIMSTLQHVDLNDTRNVSILGISVIIGFTIPYYISKTPNAIDTGVDTLDRVLSMLCSNGVFMAGVVSFFLDNTVSGTRKSRGLETHLGGNEATEIEYEEGPEVYDIPWLPKWFKYSWFVRYCPMFEKYEKEKDKLYENRSKYQ